MDYSKIKTQIIIRVAAIALTLLLLFHLSYNGAFSLTIILFLVLAFVQVFALIKFLSRTYDEINNFFEAIKNNDFSEPQSSADSDGYTRYLREQFSFVLHKLRKSKLTKDERYHYLTTIVQHAGIGLITFNEKGEIQIMNIAAKRLLKVESLKNIDELSNISQVLVDTFKKLKTGGRDLIKIDFNGDIRQLSVYAIELSLVNEHFKLISLQNIQSELEENEMEAWQKLVRVLTHEIMNSVTPISSLATTVEADVINRIDHSKDKCEINKEDLEDIHLALQTIQRRSEGLIRFVSDFRSLTHTPQPKFELVEITDLFDQIWMLMKSDIEKEKIDFNYDVNPENLTANIDPELIQQVLINLIKNAIQAVEEKDSRQIEMLAFQDEKSRAVIVIKDNGAGIDEEAQSKIFIPFFTTKKKGSGIGLSLSRQIMRQHKGSISVKSKVNEGAEFTLRF